jgi:SAM-dependent methyltransferase
MTWFTPSRDSDVAERTVATLIRSPLAPSSFARRIQHLQRIFSAGNASCPPPWSSQNLQITPEITYQSELWLPLGSVRPHFYSLYRHALTYAPVFSSTPFASSASWAEMVSDFPTFLHCFSNPALLLESLVNDDDLRRSFLFWSFMPRRFYGSGSDRYPGQIDVIVQWGRKRSSAKPVRCLDAASGDGSNTYRLAQLLFELGWPPELLAVEGWTLDPLEVWAAAHGCFPHDPVREAVFREETSACFESRAASAIRFCSADILEAHEGKRFDLILCNGLLGGPIIHGQPVLEAAVRNLAGLLEPGGMLLADDHFHGGWRQKCPQQVLRALCEKNGFVPGEICEGVAALKPDQ